MQWQLEIIYNNLQIKPIRNLALLHEIQNQIIETQNENWQKVEKQFRVLRDKSYDMRHCDQLSYTRQQENFNFDTTSSLLSLIYSTVKSYGAALFAFQMNILNAIPSLLSKYVPMSLLPKESLGQILKVVDDSQEKSDNRITMAILPEPNVELPEPMANLFSLLPTVDVYHTITQKLKLI